jgi:hypothetical protein
METRLSAMLLNSISKKKQRNKKVHNRTGYQPPNLAIGTFKITHTYLKNI